jgi:multiple sugar transport system permease protein
MDAYRLFMVPGMAHCGGGTGTDQFDMLTALEEWVEQGEAPDVIEAARSEQGQTTRTRPLCPWPQTFGIAMHILDVVGVDRVPIFKTTTWFMPAVALVTIWWTAGFSILLFLAGLRAIPTEIYEAAALDNAGRWTTFRRITWPLLWPVTSLVFTIQLILQLKIFDQVYLFSVGGRPNDNLVLVYYIWQRAFVNNQGGRAAAIAVTLFVIVIVVSVLQFQLLRLAGRERRA